MIENKTITELNQRVGRNIQILRKSRSVSAEQLAELVEMSAKHYSEIENGKVNISLNHIEKICRELDIPEKVVFENFKQDITELDMELFERFLELPNEELKKKYYELLVAFNEALNQKVLTES
ncbi:MAG: helix-turn-helix domain-containing protein [Candidatus Pacebacteria bacterium]|nr:helix-turn-helix domain-containing protein [Candidatus Paceibacterota bacterium]